MSFTDWVFFTRVTELTLPSSISFISEDISPLQGNASLLVEDTGAPAVATVAFVPNPYFFDDLVECGRLHTIFRKRSGAGFQDYGLFFLSQGSDPTRDNVVTYAVYFSSGSTTVRLMKYPNGLHNYLDGVLLQSYTVPFSGNVEPVVLEAEWLGGLLNRTAGYTNIQIRFGSNTTNFSNLVNLSPVIHDSPDSLFTGSCGVFVRSRHQSDPLRAIVDMTELYRKNLE